MKIALAVAFAAFASFGVAARSAHAQTVAMNDESLMSSAVPSDTAPTPAPMASIAVRGHIGRDGAWHEATAARGGGPARADRGPVPQEPLVNGSPAPIAAPPPAGRSSGVAAATAQHVVYVYRDRLHAQR